MLLRLLVLTLLLMTGLARAAGTDFTIPTIADLEKQLASVGQSGAPEEKGKSENTQSESSQATDGSTRQRLETTLELRKEIKENRERIESLKSLATQAPARKKDLRQQLREARRERNEDWTQRYQSLSLSVLSQELIQQLDALKHNQQQLAEVSSKLTRSRTLPERAQSTISDSLARIDEIRARLAGETDGNELSQVERNKLETELTALQTRITLRNQELNKADTVAEIARLRKRLLETRATVIQQRLDALQPLINEKRTRALKKELDDRQIDLPPALAEHPLIQAARERNQDLRGRLRNVSEDVSSLMRQGVTAKARLERLRSLARTVHDQIRMIDGSLLLSRILYQQQKSIPDLKLEKNLDKRITEVRLAQFDITQQRQQLDNTAPTIDDPALTDSQRSILQSALSRLWEARWQLLDQIDQELGSKLNILVHLQLAQEQLTRIAGNLRAMISERTFWMPSTQPISLDWFRSFPEHVKNQFRGLPWQDMAERASHLIRDKWPWLLLPLLPALLLWSLRRPLQVRVRRLNADIGFLKRDSQLHTPLSIFYTALICTPGPVIIGLLAWGLWLQPGSLASVLGAALLKIALLWLVFELCYRLLASNGIAQRHFRWTREKNLRLRRRLLAVGLTMVPMTLIIAFGEQWPSQLTNDRIGLLVMIACLINLSLVLSRAALSYPTRHYSRGLRVAATVICAAIPLILVVLIALGYYYTAARLSGRMIDSFYMLLVWILFDAAAVRGLAVAAQRLAYKRAVAQREAEAQDSPAGAEGIEVEEPQMDLQQVNQQSLRLIRLALFAGFGLLLYLVWEDVLSAFSYTDSILLWQSVQEGASLTNVPVSLGDVMTALVIGVLTFVLASNLPGLLEVLLLSRLTLRPGTSYATTTLLSYVIAVIGIIIALGSLGLSWGKMQWLVAALGVGLGFGLQEIFANFISGIIILFERPIRIGDVITLNNLSGTVSRIRIRATTLIDFDRKEIIVPNKAFVTERLINWTLSDTVIRVTLKVGFAYGSDLDTVDELLHKVARENPRVLPDPEPLILFMAFSDNALDYEVRVYLREIGDILSATDELNHAIDKACRDQGVEIAFNQMDVHLRTASDDFRMLHRDGRRAPDAGYHYGSAHASDEQPG